MRELRKKEKELQQQLAEQSDELKGLKLVEEGLRAEIDGLQKQVRGLMEKEGERVELDVPIRDSSQDRSEKDSAGSFVFGKRKQDDRDGAVFSFKVGSESRDEFGRQKIEGRGEEDETVKDLINGRGSWKEKEKMMEQDGEENIFAFNGSGGGQWGK